MSTTKSTPTTDFNSRLIEGEDYYSEGTSIVFTARYLLRRGHCCETGCRHCPYEKAGTKELSTLKTKTK